MDLLKKLVVGNKLHLILWSELLENNLVWADLDGRRYAALGTNKVLFNLL